MRNGFRSRLVLLMSVLIFVSASSFIIIEEGSQSLDASPDTSTAVALSDGFTLSTTGSGTMSGYTIVVVVPGNNGAPYKDYTISFTGSFTVPAPSHGEFTSSMDANSGPQTVKYTANDGATRAQIGSDLSTIVYKGAGTVTVTATDGPSATQAYKESSIGNNVYVSTIGGGPKHYSTLSDAYTNADGTDAAIRLLTDVVQNEALNITKDLTITSDSSSRICSIRHSSDSGTTILDITKGTVLLKDVTIDGNKQGSGFLITVASMTDTPSLTLGSGATVKNGAAGGIRLGLEYSVDNNAQSHGSLFIKDGAVIEGNADGYYNSSLWFRTCVGGIAVRGQTTFVMDGGEIRNNTATKNDDNTLGGAGGISFCYNTEGTAEMNGGKITGNTAPYGAGAIYAFNCAKLTLNGGTITGNHGGNGNGAVSVMHESVRFYIGGFDGGTGTPLVIQDNYTDRAEKNVYLNQGRFSGSQVYVNRVDGKVLAEGSMIGLSLANPPLVNYNTYVNTVLGSTEAEMSYFKSDEQILAGTVREASTGIIKLDYYSRGSDDVYVSGSGDDVSGNGTSDKPYKTLARAYELVRDHGTIHLMSNIDATSCMNVESKNVTIASDGRSVFTVTRTSDTNLIYVKSGSVTLQDITLTDSEGKNGQRQTALVLVALKKDTSEVKEVSATLVMASGSTVKGIGMANPRSDTELGEQGAIVVYPGGKLKMENGATIKDCTTACGPVYCYIGIFEMSGGTISGCSSRYENGATAVYLSMISTMTMSGGTITGCGGSNENGAGTIYMDVGKNTFQMSGGSITGNTAKYCGGVYSDDRTGAGRANTIKVSGTAYISGNKDTSGEDSNVRLADGQCIVISGEMSDGAKVGVQFSSFGERVKIAEFANGVAVPTGGYADYFSSDKPHLTGILFKDDTLYLSIEKRVGYGTTGPGGIPGVNRPLRVASGSDMQKLSLDRL